LLCMYVCSNTHSQLHEYLPTLTGTADVYLTSF